MTDDTVSRAGALLAMRRLMEYIIQMYGLTEKADANAVLESSLNDCLHAACQDIELTRRIKQLEEKKPC